MGKTFVMLLEPASSVTDFALGFLAIGAALLVERKLRWTPKFGQVAKRESRS